jgi:hypothetical protein
LSEFSFDVVGKFANMPFIHKIEAMLHFFSFFLSSFTNGTHSEAALLARENATLLAALKAAHASLAEQEAAAAASAASAPRVTAAAAAQLKEKLGAAEAKVACQP